MAIDEAKLNAFMGRFVGDLGAVMHAATVVVGDQLGLYKALAESPMTPEQLAARTSTDPRYVREWLSSQAASGYVHYDPASGAFSLDEEQTIALAVEKAAGVHPGRVPDRRRAVQGDSEDHRRVQVRQGTRLARARRRPVPRHRALLPARLRGEPRDVVDPRARRSRGEAPEGRVGRRRGMRTRRVDDDHGRGVPASRFVGFDYHEPVDRARARGREEGRRRGPRRASRSRPRRTFPRPATTWSRSSTACTTWATRSAPRDTCARRWRRTGPG